MDLRIDGKSAIVCGASRGLGRACAEALAGEGALVTLVARRLQPLQIVADRIAGAGGRRPAIVAADVATAEGRAAVKAASAETDILVTNAGGPPAKDFTELTLGDWERALETNFLSAVEMIRVFAPSMSKRRWGRIVNITSATVRMPVERLDLSTSARLALTGYVAGVARQIAKDGVTINNLLPGTVMTERLAELGATAQALIARVPAGRAGKPEEVGAACAFLCSEQAGFITGQSLLVDGGLCALTI
ncbi:SDR family oxidoreductase [Methylocystis bryophila]|uniref:Short-chain dehydrogenase n=1 Tax=Methylocystis bryophila TaxID=655015 RepID=A0A1W6MZ00_9HYPH|nr:SDR family oxidoreductase [Methylocystis bryophila]ARN82798.1 short-chain dehydrogenase [Methylocystis bryophila]BDV39043.1 dehydrogenase [Methylocystis bryophila]